MSIAKRIAQIQKEGEHSASSFADTLGIQRSGLSHIYSGRNKPSVDFIQKLLEAFPEYNAAWIINGTLPVKMSTKSVKNDLSSSIDLKKEPFQPSLFDADKREICTRDETNSSEQQSIDERTFNHPQNIERKLRQIIMIYDDNTFEIFVQGYPK